MLRKLVSNAVAWLSGAVFLLGALAQLGIQLAGIFGHTISL